MRKEKVELQRKENILLQDRLGESDQHPQQSIICPLVRALLCRMALAHAPPHALPTSMSHCTRLSTRSSLNAHCIFCLRSHRLLPKTVHLLSWPVVCVLLQVTITPSLLCLCEHPFFLPACIPRPYLMQ
jgi:hypothetical protein